ncbi:MAG: hypothetical protein KAJ18_11130 [Candidatus Omnitrophica bacterium]|nr:hypothetical protein [Candidatus Omnitrophota bacterium]
MFVKKIVLLLDIITSIGYIVIMMIIEGITKAINKSGKTRYQISKETGIDEAVLCRIVSGGSCSMKTADILCKYLKLKLVSSKKKAR